MRSWSLLPRTCPTDFNWRTESCEAVSLGSLLSRGWLTRWNSTSNLVFPWDKVKPVITGESSAPEGGTPFLPPPPNPILNLFVMNWSCCTVSRGAQLVDKTSFVVQWWLLINNLYTRLVVATNEMMAGIYSLACSNLEDITLRFLNSWFRASWFNVNKKVQLDATICRHLFTAKSLYMFRVSQHPSPGVLKTVSATSGIGHDSGTATSFQRGLIRTHQSWSGHVGRK